MIIWNGLGFLVAVFVFGAALLCNFAFDAAWGDGYYSNHKWTVGVAMLIAAVPSGVVGWRLRKRAILTVIVKETGEEMTIERGSHGLFFIPMHLWGGILVIVGGVLCVLEFVP